MKRLSKGSECWNFMSKCRGIISKYLTWDVGVGNKALFWEDSWNGLPPIQSSPNITKLTSKLKSLWGSKVVDYKVKVISDGQLRWIWRPIDELELEPESVIDFKKITSNRKINQSERSDSLIWAGSKDGVYNVKHGYQSIIHSQQWNYLEISLKLCWDPTCLAKAGFFLWIFLHNRALTTDRFARFGISGPNWCVMCKQSNKDVDHLFLNCPFAQNCWEWIKSQLKWSTPFPKSLKGLLNSWPTHVVKGVYNKLWNIFPSLVVWELWKERNFHIFINKERNLDNFLLKLEVAIIEVMKPNLRKSSYEEGSFSF